MNTIKLRISDARHHAEEFEVESYRGFVAALNDALIRYNAWHADWAGGLPQWQTYQRSRCITPRPELHVMSRGKWIDAGYGRGTYIVLHNHIAQNRGHLQQIWERCQSARADGDYMNDMLNGLISGGIMDFVRNDSYEKINRRRPVQVWPPR